MAGMQHRVPRMLTSADLLAHPCTLPAPPAGSSSPEAQTVSHLVRERVAPLLGHSLSPLAACLPSVANEFSHQTDSLGLLRAADIARYMQQQVRGCRGYRCRGRLGPRGAMLGCRYHMADG
jgi:hypothetical protein